MSMYFSLVLGWLGVLQGASIKGLTFHTRKPEIQRTKVIVQICTVDKQQSQNENPAILAQVWILNH